MQHGDLKNFIMMHQHTEARNHFPWNTRNPCRNPPHALLNTRVLRNPCWRTLC